MGGAGSVTAGYFIMPTVYRFCSKQGVLVEYGAVEAKRRNEDILIKDEEEEEVEEAEEKEEAGVFDEREKVEGGVMDRNTMEGVREEVMELEVEVTQVVLDEGVKEEVETMAAEEGEGEVSDVEGVKEEVEAAGGQPTDQVGRPLVLGSSLWTRPTGHNQPDNKKGEEEEEMTEEDLEVARIMSHLPPIVPTIREQPRSWL